MFELRPLNFFTNQNECTGSLDGMRYRLCPKEDSLLLWVWYTDVCFALADAGEPETFPLSAEGLDAVRARLEECHAAASEKTT